MRARRKSSAVPATAPAGTVPAVVALAATALATILLAAPAYAPLAAYGPGVATAAESGSPAGASDGSSGNAEPQASLPQLEGEVMCPTCGTLLELSHAPAAERERVFIRRLIAQGKSEDEIKDALVAEYGSGALAEPDDAGINFWAYVLPLLVFAVALVGIIFGVFTWRRNRDGADDRPRTGEPEPEDADSDRLDRDIARFDL